jgi:short-subunit dehydrogenase
MTLYALLYWVCFVTGLLACSNLLYYALKTIKRLRAGAHHYDLNTWALVTGASDGIGKALAFDLAKRGLNVVLVARNKVKLEHVAQEITEICPAKVRIVVVDFARFDLQAYRALTASVESLKLSLIVHNVGCLKAGFFSEQTQEDVLTMINTNIWPQVYVTHALRSQLLNATSRLSVLTVGSVSGHFPMPFSAIYSATKAFNIQFSLGVAGSFPNVGFSVVCPGYVDTNLVRSVKQKFRVITPEYFSECALAVTHAGLLEHAGSWSHEFQSLIFSLAPEDYLLRRFKDLRQTNYQRV